MQLPALQLLEQKLERHKRLFELRKGALEKRIERQIQLFEQRKGALEKKLEQQFENHKRKFEQKFDTQRKRIEKLGFVTSRKRTVFVSMTRCASSAPGSRSR